MVLPFFSPAELDSGTAGPEGGEEPSGGKVLRLIRIRLAAASLQEMVLVSQANLPQNESPMNAVIETHQHAGDFKEW
jgi:hypothetical protein